MSTKRKRSRSPYPKRPIWAARVFTAFIWGVGSRDAWGTVDKAARDLAAKLDDRDGRRATALRERQEEKKEQVR